MKLLFVGDVVGGIGRRTLTGLLPSLREEHRPDFVIANGENAAGGVGITEKTARELLDAGVDALTLGNHAYRHKEVFGYLDSDAPIVRPSNFPRSAPGRGHLVVESDGMRLGVVNISGTVFVEAARSPFAEVDQILSGMRDGADFVLVDFHAEATSEKVAMGWHLDGRVTACVGHAHPRPDRRRPRAPGRDRLRDRRRHDGPAGGRDRRAARAGAAALPDHGAHPVPDLRRGPVAQRRAGRGGRGRPGDLRGADTEARGMSFDAYEIDLHGHSMEYRRAGEGPPVVLIHGMVNSSRHWEKVALLLAERYSVIAPDLIGHGDSAGPRGDYSLGAHASRIRDLLTVLGIERATMVGHSYGGGVAMQYFWQFPQRTERLALISGRRPRARGQPDAAQRRPAGGVSAAVGGRPSARGLGARFGGRAAAQRLARVAAAQRPGARATPSSRPCAR